MQASRKLTGTIVCVAIMTVVTVLAGGEAPHSQPACSHVGNAEAKPVSGKWTLVAKHAAFSPRDTGEGTVFAGKMWMSHGWAPKPEDKREGIDARDLWNSTDGVTWKLVSDETPYDLYSEMVAFQGKLWAVKASVWNSDDGHKWSKVLDKTPFGGRGYGELVVFKDRMWQLGSGEDVWSTADGIHWTKVADKVPYGDRATSAVVAYKGKLWVMAGRIVKPNTPPEKTYKDYTSLNDVWCSEDGATWTRVLEEASWVPRMWSVAEVYADRMWIIGGFDNRNGRNLGDVWTSTDGKHWQRFESETQFEPRHEVTPYVYNDSLWVVAGNIWPVVNDVWRFTLPEAGKPQSKQSP